MAIGIKRHVKLSPKFFNIYYAVCLIVYLNYLHQDVYHTKIQIKVSISVNIIQGLLLLDPFLLS